MDLNTDKQLREQLIKHLQGGEAFTPIDKLIHEMPYEKAGIIPDRLPYSFWQQLYHMRFAQYDILEFSRNSEYKYPNWPQDYWPARPAPEDEQEWKNIIKAFFEERQQFCNLISDPGNNLLQPFAHGSGQTLLREALLIIEHTAYHAGEMVIILRLLRLHK